ncbi:helix-turn-helix domain-containing protein [Saccharomonospora sp. NPDC006951]
MALEGLLRRLLSAGTVSAAAQAAVDTVREVLPAEISWSGVVSGDDIRLAAYGGLRTAEMPALWHLAVGQGIGGRVAKERRTIAVRDYRRDPRRVPVMKSIIDAEGVRGGACAPLLCGDDVLGVLYAADRCPRDWTDAELRLLTDIGRDTGVALAQIRERHLHQERCEAAERAAGAGSRAVEALGAIAMSLVRTEDLSAGIGVLAHHIGMSVALLDPEGQPLYKAPPGGDDGEPVRVEVGVGEEPFGILRVSGAREPERSERELVEVSGYLVTLQLLRERAALRAESRVHSEFLDSLLLGRFTDREGMLARAALLDVALTEPRFVVCISAKNGKRPGGDGDGTAGVPRESMPPTLTRRMFIHVEESVRRHYPHSMVNPRTGEVVVLLQPDGDDLGVVLKTLREGVIPEGGKGLDLVAGVGRLCLALEDYPDSYAEAVLALDIARRGSKAGEVLAQGDLGLYGLLARAPSRQSLESIVDSALGPLIESDADGGTDYVRTLHAYLDADRHLERAAADLHVHPNTVRYRLSKAQHMLGVSLRDVNERFLLELALRVQRALERQ